MTADHWREKVKTAAEAREMVARAREAGKTVVFTNGCFDLLHGGHISYLEESRAQGDLLVLGLNSDASIRELKGHGRPVYPLEQRLEILAALESVDCIVVFEERSCDGLLAEIHPDIHAKGTDYTAETVPERETARRLGIRTVIAGAPKENSTRDIIDLVIEKNAPSQS
jgi:rfaE bifunctional protein nucleotidyltransferase chain/domain